MMAKAATAKKERLKKKRKGHPSRPDPTRIRKPDRHPPPPEARRSLRPPQRSPLDEYFEDDEEEEEEERGRRKLKLVLKLPHIPTGRCSESTPVTASRYRKPPSVADVSPSAASSDSHSSASTSLYLDEEEEEAEEEIVKPPKKRKIESCNGGVDSDGSVHREERKKNVVQSSIRSVSGTPPASRTPLPERKELESILDKLQKKDIYGVFAEPVDPEELPDYHDVIEHPMDFGTVRRKLVSGAYRSFVQFEDDVFLICSNAMQYNAPDTIYFRQARAIQDMARKKFQEIRANVISTGAERKFEEKSRFGPMEKKTLRKPQCRTASEALGSDISSGATLASAADTCTGLGTVQANGLALATEACTALSTVQDDGLASVADACTGLSTVQANGLASANGFASAADVCTGSSTVQANCLASAADACTGSSKIQANGVERSVTINGFVDGNCSLGGSKSEKADAVPAKCSPSKLVPKPFMVDENRRATYITLDQQPVVEHDLVFDVFEGEPRQLIAVGLHAEYSYARSLVHFAASLGPIGWEIASKRIEQAVPPGVKFGPGWVGEYEPLPTPVLSLENHTQQQQQQKLTVSRKDKENKMESEATQNGHHKDMPFSLKTQMSSGMPSNRASNPAKEGTVRGRTQERKQGLFGVNLEEQPRITSRTSQQQQNQAALDFAKAYQVKTEAQEQLEAVTQQRRNNDLGMDVGVLSDGKLTGRSNNGSNSSFGIISNHQAQHWLARGSQEQPINDPLRWMNTSRKISNQPNTSSADANNLGRSVPTVLQPRRENPNASAARAWMSIGASTEWKSVDGRCLPNKQVGSPSFSNSARKTPTSASMVHEDSKIKSEPFQGVSEASQVQDKGLVFFPQLIPTDRSRLRSPWQGLVQHNNKQKDMLPPDLNISFQPPGSPARPSSGILVDSQQPDLALQL